MLDLIFLIVIAGFLIFRLYSVLGHKYEVDEMPKAETEPTAPPQASSFDLKNITPAQTTVSTELEELEEHMPDFDPESFFQGAEQAFIIILKAFQEGDLKTLQSLLSPKLYKEYAAHISKRTKDSYRVANTLERLKQMDIRDAVINSKKAHIKVAFHSEQVCATYDKKGALVEGDPDVIENITDLWTFERPLNSNDPNWILVAAKHG